MTLPELTLQTALADVPSQAVSELLRQWPEAKVGWYALPGPALLRCVYGPAPHQPASAGEWTAFVLPQAISPEIRLLDDSDQLLTLTETSPPLSITLIKAVEIAGQRYSLWRDAWGNLSTYTINNQPDNNQPQPGVVAQPEPDRTAQSATPEITPAPPEKLTTVFHRVLAVREAALEDETAVTTLITEYYGPEVTQLITDALQTLEEYPELTAELAHHYWSGELDLWDLAYRGRTLAGAKQLLTAEQPWLRHAQTRYQSQVPERCEAIISKLVTHQPLTYEDQCFHTALSLAKLAATHLIRETQLQGINEFTRSYSLANVAENLLCREFAGWETYAQHQADFQQFTQQLTQAGDSVPAWFRPYQGQEFWWSVRLDAVMATDQGRYFIDKRFRPELATQVFDHERIHVLLQTALRLGREAKTPVQRLADNFASEAYEESYTQAFALLLRAGGNLTAALSANDVSQSEYKTGTGQLLRVLAAIGEATAEPESAMRLVWHGLQTVADGQALAPTEVIGRVYDELVQKVGAFRELMEPYQDLKLVPVPTSLQLTPKVEPDTMRVRQVAAVTLARVYQSDLAPADQARYPSDDLKFQQVLKQELLAVLESPLVLVGPESTALLRHVLVAVQSQPLAAEQLRALVRAHQLPYVQALRRVVPTLGPTG